MKSLENWRKPTISGLTPIVRMDWQGSEDDITAKSGRYILRVEQMDTDSWWWCVWFGGVEIASDCLNDKFAQTKRQAKMYCIEAMLEHKSK